MGIMISVRIGKMNRLRAGSKSVTGFKTAVTLAQVGEFSFAIFALASVNNLLDPEIAQTLVLTVVLSMIATPFMLANRKKLRDQGIEHVVVDYNYARVKQASNAGEEIYYDDMSKPAILQALHVQDAASVVVTLDNSEKKLLICEVLAAYGKRINVIVKINSSEEKRMLCGLPISVKVNSNNEIANTLVKS